MQIKPIPSFLLVGMFLIIFMGSIPSIVDARHNGRESSAYQSKINKLDDDVVKKIPIPILFGIDLNDIYPNFGDPRDGGDRTHEGLDIMAPEGAPIVSPTEAVVISTGNDSSGAGKYVRTANPGGETFTYMHLSEISVKSGAVLKEGALIGYVGDTGNASGGAPHLHFEIRENREPTDPYERIKKEFTLAEKIEFLEDVLDDAKDEDELIEFLVDQYEGVFYQAQREKLTLPKELLTELPKSAGVPTRDLDIGATGSDVMEIQSVLIAEGFLNIEAPTGSFGVLTKEALRAYQVEHDINPANGYYGSVTRAYLAGNIPRSVMNLEEMVAKIAELTALLKKLQAQQNAL